MKDTKELRLVAAKARLSALDAIHEAKSGHPGGSMSCMDALAALYFHEMNIRPEDPAYADRDRFVLSKGHCAPALYSILAHRGFFPVEDLKKLRKIDAHLSGHPDMTHVPGVDMSTGSLGQGLSTAVGMALAGKTAGKNYRVYAICGDGEMQEGQIWEAAMAAAKWQLDSLCIFVDQNGLQIDGATDDVMPLGDLEKKFQAFNWNTIRIDGNNMEEILDALEAAKAAKGKPTAILMKTVKGKGVSFMENLAGWHGKAPNDEQFEEAKAELTNAIKEIEGE